MSKIGDKIDHFISCRGNFLIPFKIALRVVMFHYPCRRVHRFVVIQHSRLNHFVASLIQVVVQSSFRRKSFLRQHCRRGLRFVVMLHCFYSFSRMSKAKKTRQDVATQFIHYYILCTTTTRLRIAVALVMTLHIIYFNTLMLFRFLTLLISYRKKNYAKGNGSLFLDKRIRKAVFTVTVACYRGNDIFHHFRDIPQIIQTLHQKYFSKNTSNLGENKKNSQYILSTTNCLC